MSYERADFKTYIYRVLKHVHPDTGLSGDGLSSTNNFIKITLKRIMNVVNRLMLGSGGRKTISAREIQTAVRLAFPGELAKHAVSEGTKAVITYNMTKGERKSHSKGEKLAPVSKSKVAGLLFPVTRVENIMMELATVERKSEGAAVYFAAVLEYICAELLEIAGNVARDFKKVRITPRHIKLAILNDEELVKLFKGALMSGGVALTSPMNRRQPRSDKKSSPKKIKSSKKDTKSSSKKKTKKRSKA
jgi:histone H3/H4